MSSANKVEIILNQKQFQKALRLGYLNQINLFAKGHHAGSYYTTESGTIHPNLNSDLLGAEMKACYEIESEKAIAKNHIFSVLSPLFSISFGRVPSVFFKYPRKIRCAFKPCLLNNLFMPKVRCQQ